MPRILIAGCGYVGEAVADLFQEADWEVEGWTSSPQSAQDLSAKPYAVLAVDIADDERVKARAQAADAIIHCASSGGGNPDDYRRIYLQGARNLIDTFPGATALFTSSTSVYAQNEGEWVTEASPVEPKQETARILLETEEAVLAGGGIVARLGAIYGPGRSFLLRKFLAGEAVIDPHHDRFINQVHRDDIASALFLLVTRRFGSQSRGQSGEREIYNVVDGQPISQRECYEWLAKRLKRPVPSLGISPAKRKRGESNKRVSNRKLKGLGWNPRYPSFEAAMTESILPALARSEGVNRS